MKELQDLVENWTDSKQCPWAVLYLCGFRDWSNQEYRMMARSQSLGIQCDVLSHFDERYGQYPFLWLRLVGGAYSTEEKNNIIEWGLKRKSCCKTLFNQCLHLRGPSCLQFLKLETPKLNQRRTNVAGVFTISSAATKSSNPFALRVGSGRNIIT